MRTTVRNANQLYLQWTALFACSASLASLSGIDWAFAQTNEQVRDVAEADKRVYACPQDTIPAARVTSLNSGKSRAFPLPNGGTITVGEFAIPVAVTYTKQSIEYAVYCVPTSDLRHSRAVPAEMMLETLLSRRVGSDANVVRRASLTCVDQREKRFTTRAIAVAGSAYARPVVGTLLQRETATDFVMCESQSKPLSVYTAAQMPNCLCAYLDATFVALDDGNLSAPEIIVSDIDLRAHRLVMAVVRSDMKYLSEQFDKGLNVNFVTSDGQTLLMDAAILDQLDVARMLVERGANICVRDAQKRSALDHAMEKHHAEIVRFLLSKQADRCRD